MLYSNIFLVFLSLITLSFSIGIAIDRDDWKVTADSSHAGNEPEKAIDGNQNTFWHSGYQPNAPLPHFFVVDLNKPYLVDGLSYQPRQDFSNNGNIGQHIIHLSMDGTTWSTPVALGTYRNDKATKATTFVGRPARFVRITAVTEAQGENNSWASIAELNVHRVPDPILDRNGWSITVDSEETAKENATGAMVQDNDLHSFWHTAWSTTAPAHPHTLEIDQGRALQFSGLLYGPRRGLHETAAPENGRVGKYKVQTSNDKINWNEVSSGEWADDFVEKAAFFSPVTARYVRLIALSEAGNRGPWTSVGEINLMFGSSLGDYQAPRPSHGLCSHTIDYPLVPAAGAILPDHEVLIWSAYRVEDFVPEKQSRTQVAIWKLGNDAMTQADMVQTKHDMFCPGVSIDFRGRVVVTGGNNGERTSIFDPLSNTWGRGADMQIGRGYQTSTTLSDGRIFEIGGSWNDGAQDSETVKPGEVYNTSSNTWTRLPGCTAEAMETNDKGGRYRSDNHAWLFAWSNSSVLHAGPSKNMNWFGTDGNGSQVPAGKRAEDVDSMNGVSAMFDAVAGKILTAGGAVDYENVSAHSAAHHIQIKGINQNPEVRALKSMSFSRAFANAIVLPDGTVFVTGGQSYPIPFSDSTAILVPELWDPRTEQFTQMNPHSIPRAYHSIGLLLPDATILSAGGGLCGGCATNHFDGEIFVPPYLLNADGTARERPEITLSSTSLEIGAQFTITTNKPVNSISLMRLGSATHSVNTDQRRIPYDNLALSKTHTITLPNDPGIFLPGHYMVFAMDDNGTPSVSKNVQVIVQNVTSQSMSLPDLEVIHTVPEPDPNSSLASLLGNGDHIDLLRRGDA